MELSREGFLRLVPRPSRDDWRYALAALGIYVVSRLFIALLFVWSSTGQTPVPGWTSDDPTYLDMVNLWDAKWYGRIADGGYPKTLPTDGGGNVGQNAWAFYPLFPLLARFVMLATGAPWTVVGPSLALVLGGIATVWMAFLVARQIDRRAGLVAISLWLSYPAAASLQMGYSESAAALVLIAFLWFLQDRNWMMAGCMALVMGVTRPIGAPMAACFAAVAAWEWWTKHRRSEKLDVEFYGSVSIGFTMTVLGTFLWQLMMSVVTGIPNAYLLTQAAWRSGGDVTIFEQWPRLAAWYLKGTEEPAVMGWLAVMIFIIATIVPFVGPWACRLGPVMIAWPLAYMAYMLTVIEPFTSLVRYLLMLFPMGLVLSGVADEEPPSELRIWTRTLVVAVVLIALQVWWVRDMASFTPPSDFPP